MRLAALPLALALLLGVPPPAAAQSFDIAIRGLRAGALSVEGQEADGRYALTGRLESRGVLGAVRPFRYDATARGLVQGSRLVPELYAEEGRRGDRRTRTAVRYADGVPGPRVSEPPDRPDRDALDPAMQGGTVDLLTGTWTLLRDTPPEAACRARVEMFDGERRSRIVTGEPERREGRVTCTGEYRRLGGFSAEAMAERQRFPFRLTYRPGAGGLLEVERLELETVFGRGVMTRR